MVRAKFKCDTVTRMIGHRKKADGTYGPCEQRTVVMSPVYGNNDPNHENSKFWDASPGGKLELNVVNLPAAGYFEPGQEYYLDFTKAG